MNDTTSYQEYEISDEEILQLIRQIEPLDFEYFIADLWEQMGWETRVTNQSGDRGIDVIASREHPFDQTVVIQAKRYGADTKVGSRDAREYAGSLHEHGSADSAVIVTSGGVTSGAFDSARETGVKIISGQKLATLIQEENAVSLIEEYASNAALRKQTSEANRDHYSEDEEESSGLLQSIFSIFKSEKETQEFPKSGRNTSIPVIEETFEDEFFREITLLEGQKVEVEARSLGETAGELQIQNVTDGEEICHEKDIQESFKTSYTTNEDTRISILSMHDPWDFTLDAEENFRVKIYVK